MTDVQKLIRDHLTQSADVKRQTAERCSNDIERAAAMIVEAFKSGGKLLICGNGGSAADAQHMAAELVNRLTVDFDRRALPALALTTDSSVLTAYANDVDFSGVFARQVEALGRPGDVLLGISTSGSSRNVVTAVDQATRLGLRVITLTGERGALAGMGDVAIQVPATSSALIQEAHAAVEHILCHIVERSL